MSNKVLVLAEIEMEICEMFPWKPYPQQYGCSRWRNNCSNIWQ